MTNFLRDNTPRRIIGSRDNPSKRIYAVLCVIGIIVFLFFGRYFLSARMMAIAEPIWGIEKRVQLWLSPITSVMANKIELDQENSQLKKTIQNNALELQRLNLVLGSYRNRANLFSEKELADENSNAIGHLATILARPPVSPFDTLVLNIDQSAGAREGDLVYAPGGVLLGEVRELNTGSSKALLYSAPGEKHNGFIQGLGPILLTGQGGGNFIAEFPKDAQVAPGTLITLEGRDSIILAKVGTTTRTEGDSFQRIYAQTPVTIQSLQWIRIIPHE